MASFKFKISSSHSAAVVEGNDDLLIEILLFLPPKSVLTLKSVSKRWRSLISAPLFCRRHTLRRRETQTLLLIGHGSNYVVCNPTIPKLQTFRLDLVFPSVFVLHSCNGLLLSQKYDGEGKCYRHRHYVFNPTTMHKRELPPLPCKSYAGMFLMFDPHLSPHYDVVCFTNQTRKGTLVYLYKSGEAHEWKVVGDGIKMGVSCRSGYYFNGGIFFPRFRSSCLFTPDCNITKIPNIPQYRSRGRHQKSCIVECNGVMWSLTLSWKEESNLLIVCEMKEKERRWRKKHEVDMNPIMAKCGWARDCRGISFVGMVRAEREEDYVLVFFMHANAKIYRFCDGVVEDLDCSWGYVHPFIESLALV